MFWLLVVIIVLLLTICDKLDDANPHRSHAEWIDGKWNGRQ